ncbi:MAG: flavodoxin family protein [Phycisphaerae bacterium]|nr:flavodoxin family protein [Phycisphaerae bacterium]
MRLLSVNGSPRKNGNTASMLGRVCGPLASAGVEIDEVYLHGLEFRPCTSCTVCMKMKDRHCHGYKGDDCNDVIDRAIAADVILLGSPVYFGSVTGQIKAFMDRVGFVNRVNDLFLNRKIGAAVTPARRAGELLTFAELNMWFLINGMVVPGSSYWNVGHALKEGEIEKDKEAMETCDELARNLLWLLEKLR